MSSFGSSRAVDERRTGLAENTVPRTPIVPPFRKQASIRAPQGYRPQPNGHNVSRLANCPICSRTIANGRGPSACQNTLVRSGARRYFPLWCCPSVPKSSLATFDGTVRCVSRIGWILGMSESCDAPTGRCQTVSCETITYAPLATLSHGLTGVVSGLAFVMSLGPIARAVKFLNP